MKTLSPRTVGIVVAVAAAVTALHYTDNYLNIDAYPSPDWIKRETIYVAWSLLTLVGLAGYFLYRDGRPLAAGLYLVVYSYTGLSSLAHYLYGSWDEFSLKMHVLIWTDGLVGMSVLLCALGILLKRGAVRPQNGGVQSR